MQTIQNILQDINPARLNKLKKLKLRDFDEEGKNNFVAYIDDGKDSYDVKLVTDDVLSYISSACDCSNGGICDHQLAIMLNIANKDKKAKKTSRDTSKKLTETERILESIDSIELKKWVLDILNKNKDLSILFKSKFGENNSIIDETYIRDKIAQCFTSVIGRRKTVETNEAKKIAELLNISLAPILEYVLGNQTIPDYKLFKAIITELESFNFKYHISGTRITKLIENLSKTLVKFVFNIKDIEAWQKLADFYSNLIFEDNVSLSELIICQGIYDTANDNESQRDFVAKSVERHFLREYKINQKKSLIFDKEIESFIIKVFTENNLFEKHYNCFLPRRYQNEFNILIIENLITIGQDKLAEKYCEEQINGNSRQEYNIPYIKILIDLYKKNINYKKLAILLSEYGKYTFSLDDYLFIKQHSPTEKFNKYRRGVMINARSRYQNGNMEAFDFYFEVKKLDGKTSELFDMLKNCHSFDIVNQYKEIAFKINAVKFIDMVCSTSFFYVSKESVLKSLVIFIVNNTDKPKLEVILKNTSPHWRNRVHEMLVSAIS